MNQSYKGWIASCARNDEEQRAGLLRALAMTRDEGFGAMTRFM